mmetsp:Transcript_5923/g.16334  ORF Transcript_5923/g.16334 Transcript_5923/m.16334 type:complete len:237 (-) Transcript_5923:4375-5085(-)
MEDGRQEIPWWQSALQRPRDGWRGGAPYQRGHAQSAVVGAHRGHQYAALARDGETHFAAPVAHFGLDGVVASILLLVCEPHGASKVGLDVDGTLCRIRPFHGGDLCSDGWPHPQECARHGSWGWFAHHVLAALQDYLAGVGLHPSGDQWQVGHGLGPHRLLLRSDGPHLVLDDGLLRTRLCPHAPLHCPPRYGPLSELPLEPDCRDRNGAELGGEHVHMVGCGLPRPLGQAQACFA